MFIILTKTYLSLDHSVDLNVRNVLCITVLIQKTVPLATCQGFLVFPRVTLGAVQVC